jgi:chitodextrinase
MADRSRRLLTAAPIVALTLLCSSSHLSAQLRDRTAPTAPTNLMVTSTTETSASLAWGPSTDNSGKFNYVVAGGPTNVTVSQTQTSHTLTGLQSGKTYTFRVYARDLSGNLSKSSNAVTVRLAGEIAAPTKPLVTVTDVGPTHVSLAWSSTDNSPVLLYTIFVNGEMVAGTNWKSGTFTCARVMVPTYCDPINQDTTYAFTVQARDSDGNYSPMSDPVLATTDPIDPNDLTPPTQPANVTAEDTGGFHLVTWEASTDDMAPRQFIRYDVYVNDLLQTVVIGTTSAEVELYLNETSTITVIAVDTADRESTPASIVVAN